MLDKLVELYEAFGEKPILMLLSWLMLISGPITLASMLLGLRASYGRYSSESMLKDVGFKYSFSGSRLVVTTPHLHFSLLFLLEPHGYCKKHRLSSFRWPPYTLTGAISSFPT